KENATATVFDLLAAPFHSFRVVSTSDAKKETKRERGRGRECRVAVPYPYPCRLPQQQQQQQLIGAHIEDAHKGQQLAGDVLGCRQHPQLRLALNVETCQDLGTLLHQR
ncbi:Hypothetical predicted protein, partial [Drosophila guanche]